MHILRFFLKYEIPSALVIVIMQFINSLDPIYVFQDSQTTVNKLRNSKCNLTHDTSSELKWTLVFRFKAYTKI